MKTLEEKTTGFITDFNSYYFNYYTYTMPETPTYNPEQNQDSQASQFNGRIPEESQKVLEQMITELNISQAKEKKFQELLESIDAEADHADIQENIDNILDQSETEHFNTLLKEARSYGEISSTWEAISPNISPESEILAGYPTDSK